MQVSSKSLRLQAIYDNERKNILSLIKQTVISTDKGLLLGLVVAGQKVVSFNDLIWDDELRIFYIKEKTSICERHEIQRIDTALSSHKYFHKQLVRTTNGKKLGKVSDCLFDPVNGVLIAILAKEGKWIRPKKVLIHKNNIIEANASFIVVRDNQVVKIQSPKQKAAPKLRTALNESKSTQL